jgi:predicted RNA-binding protein Jag
MRDKRYRRDGKNEKIDKLIGKIKQELQDSIDPISLSDLNSFERKLVHRHFDHNPDIVTKTYRHGEDYELRVYPIGNLRNYARKKADEALQSGEKVVLPHMSNYERFIVHDVLKDYDAIKSESHGDDEDRHIVIEPEVFGRGLRKIIKKIKLF